MADWFKFYENGLDEPRFQFAVGTLSEVTPVWVGILSECCRHKSDTIGWNDDEAYLFGFSRRLNVSMPKVNEAINLLSRIQYISIKEGRLTVLKWNDFQSEYMRKKSRSGKPPVRTMSGHKPDNVRPEESRVEEKREEKKEERGEIAPAHFPEVKIPSWPEWWNVCRDIGVPEWRARDEFLKQEAADIPWKNSRIQHHAKRVLEWWKADGAHNTRPSKTGTPQVSERPRTARERAALLEKQQKENEIIKLNGQTPAA